MNQFPENLKKKQLIVNLESRDFGIIMYKACSEKYMTTALIMLDAIWRKDS